MQGGARRALHQHLRPFNVGHPLNAHGHWGVQGDPSQPLLSLRQGAGGCACGAQKAQGHLLGARLGPHQRLKAEGWHGRLRPLTQLLFSESRVVVLLECFEQRVFGVSGLQPHFAATAGLCIAPGPASGLHQQAKQTFGCPEVARKQRTVRVDGRHQGNASEIMALGDHLGADQHIYCAVVHLGQLRRQCAFKPGGVGVNPGNPHGFALWMQFRLCARSPHVREQLAQVLFKPFGTAAQRGDIGVAAGRTGARHPLGKAAVVAAQRTVDLVEHPVGAAVWTFAFPVAVGAVQHRRVATPIQENHALFAARHTLSDSLYQWRRHHTVFGLVGHVHPAHQRKAVGRTVR